MKKINVVRVALIPVISLMCLTAHALPVVDPATGNAYERVDAANITWEDARALADSRVFDGRRGHLATITSAAEQNFVFNAFKGGGPGRLWIGGFQELPCATEPAGCWMWVTEEPWMYTNWAAGQPDDAGGNQHHLSVSTTNFDWTDEDGSAAGSDGLLIEYPSGTVSAAQCIAPASCNITGFSLHQLVGTNAQNNNTITSGLVPEHPDFETATCPGEWSWQDPRVGADGHVLPGSEGQWLNVAERADDPVFAGLAVWFDANTFGSPCFAVEFTTADFEITSGIVNFTTLTGIPGLEPLLGCDDPNLTQREGVGYQTTDINRMREAAVAVFTTGCNSPAFAKGFSKSVHAYNVHEESKAVATPEEVLLFFESLANTKYDYLEAALDDARPFLVSPKFVSLRRQLDRARALLSQGHFYQSLEHILELRRILEEDAVWDPDPNNFSGEVLVRTANAQLRVEWLIEVGADSN
jgi:hypothetical protein